MRICFVSRRFFPAISGMSVYALNLLRELVRRGHDVTMVSQYRGDAEGTRIYGGGPPPPVEGVRIIGLEAVGEQTNGDFEFDIDRMVQTITDEDARQPFDIIHAQYGYPTGLAALEASRRTNVPNLVSIQGGDGHWVGTCCATHKAAMLAVLNHAGKLLIGSRSFAEEVQGNHETPLERFTIVPGAVDTNRFQPPPDYHAGRLHDPQRPTLLYHGRVDQRKGALDLLEAFKLVLAESDDERTPRLLISGIGPDSDAVQREASGKDLKQHVELFGYADYESVPKVYHQGDIFVSPTYAEGFSNTILEAMASGLPIVSTRAVGVVDCLRDNENALLVEPGDVVALARALTRMIDDEGLRAHLASQALDEVERLYSWRAVATQIEESYKELLGTTPDTNWSADVPVAPCRFRLQPHLL